MTDQEMYYMLQKLVFALINEAENNGENIENHYTEDVFVAIQVAQEWLDRH